MLSSELRVAASRRRAKFWRLRETLVERAGDGQLDFVDQARAFADVIGGTSGLDGLHCGFVVVDGSHQNHGRFGRDLMGVAQHFDAVDARHLDVGNDHVEERAVDFALGRIAGGDGFDFVTIAAQGDVEHFADGALVIADQNVTHARLLLLRLQRRLRVRRQTLAPRQCPAARMFQSRWPRPCAASARRSWCPCRLRNAPTPCPHAPARSGRR